jgi:hypothetical protein
MVGLQTETVFVPVVSNDWFEQSHARLSALAALRGGIF